MKKLILIITAFFLSCSLAVSAPSSLSCSGSYAKGGTVSCTFLNGGTAATYFDNLTPTCTGTGCINAYAGFGTEGTTSNAFSRTGYQVDTTTDNCCQAPIYSSGEQAHSETRSIKSAFTDSNTTNRYDSGYGYNGFPSTPSSVSFSYWIYIDDQNSIGHKWDGQLKTWRIQNDLTSVSDAYLGVYNSQAYWVGDGACTGAINDNYLDVGWTGSTYINVYDDGSKYIKRGQWSMVDVFYQPQTGGGGNGVLEYVIYNGDIAPQVYRSSTTETTTGSIIQISIENYLGYNTGATPCTNLGAGYGLKANVKVYTSDLVVKSLRSSIVIADSSTWVARKHVEQQVPTSRNATSASFPLNYGGFTSDTVYVYVVDDAGNANTDGYPITLGGEPPTTYAAGLALGAHCHTSSTNPAIVNSGSTTTFAVTGDSGYDANLSVSGTCGGSLVGGTYTTGAVTVNCTETLTCAINKAIPFYK